MQKLFFIQALVAEQTSDRIIAALQKQIKVNLLGEYKMFIDYNGGRLEVVNIPERHQGFMHGLLLGMLTMLPTGTPYVHVWPQPHEVHKESFRSERTEVLRLAAGAA